MKIKLLIIAFGFILNSCNTTKGMEDIASFINSKEITVTTKDCPKDVSCTVEVLKKKDLIIAKNDIGKLYPKIIDGNKIVIKYLYKVLGANGVTDGQQSESLLFVIDKETKTELENNELQEIKLLFQKNCFCKDIFGYYTVKQGKFIIKSSNNKSEINIEFTIPKLGNQQLVNKVHFILE